MRHVRQLGVVAGHQVQRQAVWPKYDGMRAVLAEAFKPRQRMYGIKLVVAVCIHDPVEPAPAAIRTLLAVYHDVETVAGPQQAVGLPDLDIQALHPRIRR